MKETKETVAVLGASNKEKRYSNMAIKMLLEHGHKVIPVHPKLASIEGLPVVSCLEDIKERIDTLTVYVGPERGEPLIPTIRELKPGRVILNPGTESALIEKELTAAGIPVLAACTLVLLRTEQF